MNTAVWYKVFNIILTKKIIIRLTVKTTYFCVESRYLPCNVLLKCSNQYRERKCVCHYDAVLLLRSTI